MKKTILILLLLICFSSGLAVRECVYDPRGFTFHCSNNMPGEQIMPGETGNITIVCCFTGKEYVDSDVEKEIKIEVINNYAYRAQKDDGSIEIKNTTYPASEWITNVSYPDSAKGFESFPVVIQFSLPENSPLYEPGEVIQSRVDIMILLEGVVPNNAVYPQIRIPSSWEGGTLDYVSGLVAGSIVGLTLLMLFQYKKRK